MLFNGEKFGLLTHNDLDGVGCYILLKDFYGNRIEYIRPTGLNNTTKNINKLKNNTKNLLITDLSLDQEYIDLIDKSFGKKFLIDHHETSFERNIPFNKIINTKVSATLLVLGWLSKKGYKPSNEMKTLVKYINDYDIWIHNHFECRMLNNIFWDSSFFDFYDMFYTGVPSDFNESEIYKKGLLIEDEKKDKILNSVSWIINNVRVTTQDKFISDVQFYFDEPFLVIINSKDKISFRSKDSTKGLTDFYKILTENNIKCGGHKFAGGSVYKDKNELYKTIELFVNHFGGE